MKSSVPPGLKWVGIRGFTLIELMVTVVIVAVLVSLAAPSYHRLVIDSRMTSQANDFLTGLHFTRSEAVKRNTTVTMCKSANATTCTTSGAWTQGWIIFVDEDPTGTAGTVDAGDLILRVHAALTDGSTLVGAGGVANLVTYQPNGQSPQSGQLNLCSSDTSLPGRDVTLSISTSIPRTAVDDAPCS